MLNTVHRSNGQLSINSRCCLRPIFSLLIIYLLTYSSYVLADKIPETIILTEQTSKYRVAGHISYLEDPDGTLDIEAARSAFESGDFKFAGTAIPNFGLTQSVYWLYFSLENQHPENSHWWLEFDNPVIDNLDLYFIDPSTGKWSTQISGDHRPLTSRTIELREPIFKLQIGYQQSRQILIRMESLSTLSASMKIWAPDKFPYYNGLTHLAYGLFYGGIISLLLYNLMLFLSIRDINYLYYCIFVSGSTIYLFCGDGLGYTYLWPEKGDANLPIALGASCIGTAFLLQFTRTFLRGKQLFPRLDKVILTLMAVGPLVIASIYFSGDQTGAARLQTVYSSVALLIASVAGTTALLKGLREARYFMFAWTALIFGIIIYNLRYNGIIASTFFTTHAMQIGSILETILLSFALAHRMKILKEENERIQEEAKQSLEKSVQKRTEELNLTMQELAKANEQLKENSFNDGLTGIRNRAYFDEFYEKEWFRSRREKTPIALLMLDIDHFKHINDSYGHLCGDHALITMANTIRALVNRPGDVIARYGGEEFAIILPDTNTEGARFIAERIRRDLEKQTLEFNNKVFKLTVSIGCASIIPEPGDLNPHELIDIADKALYTAKESGRNRVHATAQGINPGTVY